MHAARTLLAFYMYTVMRMSLRRSCFALTITNRLYSRRAFPIVQDNCKLMRKSLIYASITWARDTTRADSARLILHF
jgi:hypothetical protein